MPFYKYKCEVCEKEYEDFIHSPKNYVEIKKCPHCGKNKLRRDYSENYVGIKGEIKTVGRLAEENTKRAGPYFKDRLELKKQRELEKKYNQPLPKHLQEKGYKKIKPPKVDKKDRELMKKLGKATDKQKHNYIMDGKLP